MTHVRLLIDKIISAFSNRSSLFSALSAAVLALFALVYLPGISGPWIFDDYSNLLNNSYLKIQTLNLESLYYAAYSLQAGPLQRPIAMLSFALNHFFAGSFDDTTPFKLTNLAIHIVNGLLLAWMLRLLFTRLSQIHSDGTFYLDLNARTTTLVATAVALLWVVHPIQLTSVLYVVQRMTELSATFTLLGMIFYFMGRQRITSGRPGGVWWILFGVLFWGWLGILSKENAVLLPLFILIMEFVLFPDEMPWRSWRCLPAALRYILVAGISIVALLVLLWVIRYSLPLYSFRDFTMLERVMTEARVLFFYISLVIFPQISRFGHQHDEIAVSHSLIDPWTTLPSILGILVLIAIAVTFRRKQPLLSIGILWFFIGHLLESTLLPLEIAHEHRNYLPSLGIFIAIIHLVDRGCYKLGHRKLWVLIPIMALVFAGTTFLRATQWSDYKRFALYEALHHPNSARIQANLSGILAAHGHYAEGEAAARRAWELQPTETGFLLNMHLLAAQHGALLVPDEHSETLKGLATQTITPTTLIALQNIVSCLQTSCSSLQIPMESWVNAILKAQPESDNKSFYYYILGISLVGQGRIHEAIDIFRQSYLNDPIYLLPLLMLAKIFIDLEQVEVAEQVITELRIANKKSTHPRGREIEKLASKLAKLKQDIASREKRN